MAKKPEGKEKEHQFWDTQPVPKQGEKISEYGPLETKTLDEVPKEPYPIASVFEWWTPDVSKDEDLSIIHGLLCGNYVEDTNSTFRFSYTKEFLTWALMPPGYKPDWHVAVRKKDTKEPLAFISGIPFTTKVGDTSMVMCEINFLCVHKVLRGKKMAPILIKEVTRRVNLCDIWQAVYTAGVEIPGAFSSPTYYHRNLNPEKLVSIGFSSTQRFEKLSDPLAAMKRALALPSHTKLKLRPMEKADLPQIVALLQKQLSKFRIHPDWNAAEAEHWLLPRKDIMYTFVYEHGEDNVITDFVGFYNVPSTVLGNETYKELKAAYGYYYAANTVPLSVLMNDALILAQQLGFDVFNVLTILENQKVLQELKFAEGDGKLHYYLFNYKVPKTQPSDVGLVML